MTEEKSNKNNLNRLMDQIGYLFKEPVLLEKAMRHRSCGKNNNERLEFLGDAILSFIIAAELYHRFPTIKEGKLSRLRSTLVNETALAKLAEKFNLQQFICVSPGEKRTGGTARPSIMADGIEAMIGAIYLDSNITIARKTVLSWYKDMLNDLSLDKEYKDPKSILQEFLQSKGEPLPEYKLLKTEGKQHKKLFIISCRVSLLDHEIKAEATSIRKAEQNAAEIALKKLHYEKNE